MYTCVHTHANIVYVCVCVCVLCVAVVYVEQCFRHIEGQPLTIVAHTESHSPFWHRHTHTKNCATDRQTDNTNTQFWHIQREIPTHNHDA